MLLLRGEDGLDRQGSAGGGELGLESSKLGAEQLGVTCRRLDLRNTELSLDEAGLPCRQLSPAALGVVRLGRCASGLSLELSIALCDAVAVGGERHSFSGQLLRSRGQLPFARLDLPLLGGNLTSSLCQLSLSLAQALLTFFGCMLAAGDRSAVKLDGPELLPSLAEVGLGALKPSFAL